MHIFEIMAEMIRLPTPTAISPISGLNLLIWTQKHVKHIPALRQRHWRNLWIRISTPRGRARSLQGPEIQRTALITALSVTLTMRNTQFSIKS